MRSHELARRLLALADKEVVLVKPAGGPYHEDLEVFGYPWEDQLGSVRIQLSSGHLAKLRQSVGEEDAKDS